MKKAGFNPSALFAASEQGAWYDPSDMSTLFQDAAGTTPCYQPGQGQVDPPVGLLLDKRLGLTRGPELVSNGEFSDGTAGWSTSSSYQSSAAAVGGGMQVTSTAAFGRQVSPVSLTVGKTYVLTGKARAEGGATARLQVGTISTGGDSGAFVAVLTTSSIQTFGRIVFTATAAQMYVAAGSTSVGAVTYFDAISIKELPGNHAFQATTTSRPALSARYNLLTATDTLTTQSVTTVATSYTLKLTGAGSVTLSGTAAGSYSAGTYTITCTAGSLTLTVSGSVTQADLRPANDGAGLPPYQRVVDATTYDTAGFPLYLRFDGVDDFLQTANVDFSGAGKVLVSAALRKTSDASAAIVVELSADMGTNNGAFYLAFPRSSSVNEPMFGSRGTLFAVAMDNSTLWPAPISIVLTGIGDISGDKAIRRVNGALSLTITGDQGTGTYGNYPLYIGRRAGTSLSFNGRLYGLLIRGAATPDATIATVERHLNSKARIY